MKNKFLVLPGLLFFALIIILPLNAQNRYALVIGNSNYRSNEIASLANPANDASDVAAVLNGMGYIVTLKTDIGLLDMMNAVTDFSYNLQRSTDTEGFFWFAGHGLSVRGIHYLLPVDVEPTNESLIARGSYSVDDLMEEIGNARNKTNLVVIDACRNNLLPTGRSLGTRGLTVLSADDIRVSMNKVVYSTMAGRTAADGLPGSRNSPFAQAFIDKMQSPESFEDVFVDIRDETLRLTRGEQQPYAMGSFAVKGYALNPASRPPASEIASAASPTETAAPVIIIQQVPADSRKQAAPEFNLDGKRGMSASLIPGFIFKGMVPEYNGDKGIGGSIGITFNFFEKYRNYGDPFFLPNSFFVSAELFRDRRYINANDPFNGTMVKFQGAAIGAGVLWKIRLGAAQRFVVNFGPSLLFLTGSLSLNDYDTDKVFFEEGRLVDGYKFNTIGIGVQAGFYYRFSRLISASVGASYKQAFTRGFNADIIQDNPSSGIIYENGDNFMVNSFTLNLGISFWWPI